MRQNMLLLLFLAGLILVAGCANNESSAGAPAGMKTTNMTPQQYSAAVAQMAARHAQQRGN